MCPGAIGTLNGTLACGAPFCHNSGMGFMAGSKSATINAEAVKALEAGDRFFTPVLNMPMTLPGFSGNVADWAAMAAAVEDAGWKLHTWAVASDAKGRPQVMPLFVRP